MQVTGFEDEIVSVKVAGDNSLYLLSHKNAPRGQILRLRLCTTIWKNPIGCELI